MRRRNLNRREVVAGSAAALAASALPAAARTPPELSFLVLGDWGRKGNSTQKAVAAAMVKRAEKHPQKPAFVLTVGDNFYGRLGASGGVKDKDDQHWGKSFQDVYNLNVLDTWYPALGNHDHEKNPRAQLDYRNKEPRWKMGLATEQIPPDGAQPLYYKVPVTFGDNRTLDIFILDTFPLADVGEDARTDHPSSEDDRKAQRDWFDREASSSTAEWKLAVGHHPVYSSGRKQSRRPDYMDFTSWLEPRLKQYGIQAYIAGHDHHLEYVLNAADGVAHVLSGSGSEAVALAGQNDTITLPSNHPDHGRRKHRAPGHVNGWAKAGFTAYEITGHVLTIYYVDVNGTELLSPTIVKTTAPLVPA